MVPDDEVSKTNLLAKRKTLTKTPLNSSTATLLSTWRLNPRLVQLPDPDEVEEDASMTECLLMPPEKKMVRR